MNNNLLFIVYPVFNRGQHPRPLSTKFCLFLLFFSFAEIYFCLKCKKIEGLHKHHDFALIFNNIVFSYNQIETCCFLEKFNDFTFIVHICNFEWEQTTGTHIQHMQWPFQSGQLRRQRLLTLHNFRDLIDVQV